MRSCATAARCCAIDVITELHATDGESISGAQVPRCPDIDGQHVPSRGVWLILGEGEEER